MAYVNVADWKPDQVADWLKGLDVSIHRYVESFLNNHVNGQFLLNLQPDDLEHHGIYKVGHQEIILEAVDHLRNFHYELDHENLQLLALRVSCSAHSLHRELWNSSPSVSTQTLSDIASIIKNVKPLVCWLDRPPFSGQLAYIDKKAELLRLSLEMATSGQRDRFAERPIESIRTSAKRLAELADEMIREIHDPLLLQPASLDLATLKKRPGDHLGFCIMPSFHGNHQIGEIKCNSTAYQSGKIECGDEIVQINYQTVVGWEVKQVIALFEDSSSDIFLTLKKRPCHSKILGQIYMKPYRLPSKKVSYASKWFLGDNISPPRINIGGGHFDIKPLGHQLCNSVTTFSKNRKMLPESVETSKEDVNEENISTGNMNQNEEQEEEGDDNEVEEEEEEESISSPTSVRLYHPKPRLPVRRRATITGTGASPTSKRAPLNLEQLWNELKLEREWRLSGKKKSEKSTSEILLSATSPSETGSVETKNNIKSATKACSADCLKSVQSEFANRSKPDLSLASNKFIAEHEVVVKIHSEVSSSNETSKTDDANINFIPLKERIELFNRNIDNSTANIGVKPKIPARKYIQNEGFSSLTTSPAHRVTEKKPVARPRGKLDKSNSTPVYDFSDRPQGNTIEMLLSSERHASAVEAKTSLSRNNDKESLLNLESKVSPKHSEQIVGNTVLSRNASNPCPIAVLNNKRNDTSLSLSNMPKDSDISNRSLIDVPKPAARTLRHLLSDSDTASGSSTIFSSKQHLYSADMHISESKDSVFIEDDASQNELALKSNEKDKEVSTSIVLRDSNTMSHKIKFIDDPDSPTYPGGSVTNGSGTHIIPVNGSHSHIPPSPNSKINFPLDNVVRKPVVESSSVNVKISNEAERDTVVRLPPNSDELALSPSNISYNAENIVHVIVPALPHSPRDDQVRIFPKPSNLSSSSSGETVNKVPIACSTPIKQICQETSFCQQTSTFKQVQPVPGSSLRAIIPLKSKHKPTSPKVVRKKNSLLRTKRRNVSVKDLDRSDCEGWLFQRDRKISTVPQWIRGWFVIMGNHFYGFTDKESVKAHLFIYLPGFTVAPAVEVKSRKYALKIYHTGTTFYLAADSQDEYSTWLSCLSQSIIAPDRSLVENITFSESEGEEKSDEKSDADKSKELCFSSSKVKGFSSFLSGTSSSSKHEKKFSSLKKNKKEKDASISEHGNSSLDRKYLRFLSGNNNVPVPTEHFRSYRRVVHPHHFNDMPPSHDMSITSTDSLTSRTSPPLQLPPEMADYRLASLARAGHTMNRPREHNTTLEAFILSRQGEERRQQSAPALRPPQQFAPSIPNSQFEDNACGDQSARLSHPSSSHKDSACRMSGPETYGWTEAHGLGSSSRNCNTIPDIQTKRLKKITSSATPDDSNSLSELESTSDRTHFQRNTSKSSSSSKLKSFFHWQESSSKGILGSPRLRRVLFREKSDASNRSNVKTHPTGNNTHNESGSSVDMGQHTPDYPGLEYPPVFVPESYSLSYVTSILEARSGSGPSSNSPHDNEPTSNDPENQDEDTPSSM